jgi:hypothetical protein
MRLRCLPGLFLFTLLALAQTKYTGPQPPKPDFPYLLHASQLVATEAGVAKEESKKDDTTFYLPGASSSARTPLAEPIFILQSEKLQPEKLSLYKLEVKNGRREITLPKNPNKRRPRPAHLSITRLAPGLFRIEVSETLENGEYSLTPDDSNDVFSFQVY